MADATSDRMSWEWRRVKRSFGSRRRKGIFTQLQACNTALQNCGLERREVEIDSENQIVNLIRARLSGESIASTRDNAHILYEAIVSGLGCNCSNPHHMGHIELSWHGRKISSPDSFSLAMSSSVINAQLDSDKQTIWKVFNANIEAYQVTSQRTSVQQP